MRWAILLLVCCCSGCHLFQTVDPATGLPIVVSAFSEAADAGLDGVTTGGVVAGILAFAGTFGKSLWRLWQAHKKVTP